LRQVSRCFPFRFRCAASRKVASALRSGTPDGAGPAPTQVVERVSTAAKGYHVAAYACETHLGSGRYSAFYKVCDGAPGDYWAAHCLLKGVTHGAHSSATAALVAADGLAHLAIGNLPSLERLRDWDPVRLFRLSGLDQWPRPLPA
jgi:hypothetical protein